ncbi:MAG: shikimate dehydrogenase [Chitinophagales bacterium]
MTKHYGLIGFPLAHSFSKKYFEEKFIRENIAATYENFPLESIEELGPLLKEKGLNGFNITIPYKEAVIDFLTEMDATAEAVGAVNCVKIDGEKLIGYNTDVHGFVTSLRRFIPDQSLKALVLGTGGSSKAVSYGLNQLGIAHHFVSRRKKAEWFTYNELTNELILEHRLIINTTPLGMSPSIAVPAIPFPAITDTHYLFDLIYNPAITPFLAEGQKQGAKICNGMGMLHAQAERNWEIWNA